MTQAEKLEALVRRAIETSPTDFEWTLESVSKDGNFLKVRDNKTTHIQLMDAHRFLFLHKTARALFGEDDEPTGALDSHTDLPEYIPSWQYYLQQAVISNDPIDHMYKAVFGE